MRSSRVSGPTRIVVDRAYMPPLLPRDGDAPAASPRGTLCSPSEAEATGLGARTRGQLRADLRRRCNRGDGRDAVVGGVLVLAGSDAVPGLEPVEDPLDAVAAAVGDAVVAHSAAVGPGGCRPAIGPSSSAPAAS